ncbi:MAG: c-type cytochrome [Myxococcota bacterium]|nr:c-type cytochrome [Myxococcota bacterium]
MRVRWMLLVWLAATLPGTGVAEEVGAQHVATFCTVCHGEDLIHQQRLGEEQWRATVEKMVGWGARVEGAAMKETLVSYLAKNYGPDAGPLPLRRIETQAARAAVAPLPDDPFAGGDATRGKQRFDQDCAVCHGPAARGQLGVNLVDRYLLYRAPDFATTLREGKRQLMPGRTIDDAGVADLLAYLRTLPR